MGGHYLSPSWPSNASHYTGRTPEARPTSHNWGPPVRGIAMPSKGSFLSGGNTYKLVNHKEIPSPKGFQKHAIPATLKIV